MHFLCKKAVMDVVLLSDEARKNEFTAYPIPEGCRITWLDHLPESPETIHADLLIDLLFDNDPQRIEWLRNPAFGSVLADWHQLLDEPFVTINGWAGFLGSTLIEALSTDPLTMQRAEGMMARIGRRIEWTSAKAMTGQRIVSGIINEAFLTLEEATADEEGVDTAMKLGTNYPYGPFDWAYRIGYKKVVSMLTQLCAENPGYTVSILLKEKALAQ